MVNLTRRSFVKRSAFSAAAVTVLGQGLALAQGEMGESGSTPPPPPVPLPDPDHGLKAPKNTGDGTDSASSSPGIIRVKHYENKSNNGGAEWELKDMPVDDAPIWTFTFHTKLDSNERSNNRPVRQDCGVLKVNSIQLRLPAPEGTDYESALITGATEIKRHAEINDTSTEYKLLCSVQDPIEGDPDGNPAGGISVVTSYSITPEGESANKKINWTITTDLSSVNTDAVRDNIINKLKEKYFPLKADATAEDDDCYEIEVNLSAPMKTDGACIQEWEVVGCADSEPGKGCSVQ